MDRQARTDDTVLVKSREMTGTIGDKHCRGGWGAKRGKDDRKKQNTLVLLGRKKRLSR
jgi:hypothetical protein